MNSLSSRIPSPKIFMRLGLGLDEVHLLDAHAAVVGGSAHLVVLVVTLSRAELDVGVVGKALSEIGLAVLAAALVGIRAAVRIQP